MTLEFTIFCTLIPILLVISGFFSACETAITAASRAKIHHLGKDGDLRAKIIKELQGDIALSISALLLGATFFNTLAVSVATGILINLVGQEGIVYASFLMGALIIIYAEVAPKILAVQNPERFLLRSAKLLQALFFVLRPLLHLINFIARISLRLFGIKVSRFQNHHATLEELRGVIDLHHGPGDDTADERIMLKSILDLGSVQLEEVMTHRKNVTMINANEPPEKIVEFILKSPFTRIPVWQDNPENVVGVVNAKDLFRAVKAHPGDMSQLDILAIAADPWFVPESTDLLEQMKAFRHRHEHFAIVVDEYGALQGIVTLEDILEEIVGEISDEHDVAVKGVRPQTDGSYIIEGNVTLRDLQRQFDWDIPDDVASTLAGLILYEVRRIADVGQVFMLYGFRFEILRKQRNQITLIRVTPPSVHDEMVDKE